MSLSFPFLPFTTSLDVFLHFRNMCPVWGRSQRSANSLILGSRGSGLGTQGLPPRPSQWLGNWRGQLHANLSLHSPSFQETLFPNSLYGEILDRMEANMSKPMWYVGRCNTKALATWSLTSGHGTLRTLPTSHQGPGNEPIGELFSGFDLCQLYSLDTVFLIDSPHSLIPVALRYRGSCSVMLAPLPHFSYASLSCLGSSHPWKLPTLSGHLPPLFFQSDFYPVSVPSFQLPLDSGIWTLSQNSKTNLLFLENSLAHFWWESGFSLSGAFWPHFTVATKSQITLVNSRFFLLLVSQHTSTWSWPNCKGLLFDFLVSVPHWLLPEALWYL